MPVASDKSGIICSEEKLEIKLEIIIKLENIIIFLVQVNDIPQNLMDKFLKEHYTACEMGDQHHAGNQLQWDYISSLFFTGTILTTIGNYSGMLIGFEISIFCKWSYLKLSNHYS